MVSSTGIEFYHFVREHKFTAQVMLLKIRVEGDGDVALGGTPRISLVLTLIGTSYKFLSSVVLSLEYDSW